MTTPLSSFLANAASQASVSSLPSSSNGHSAAQSTSAVSTSLAISQAVALSNAAKVTLVRLPEQILSLRTSNANGNTSQSTSLILPDNLSQQIPKAGQAALLPASKSANDGTAATAVFISTQLAQHHKALSPAERGDLFKALAQAATSEGTAISLKGTIVSLPNGQIGLNTNTHIGSDSQRTSGGVITLPVDSESSKQTLNKLLGQAVTIQLLRNGSGISLAITPIGPGSDKATPSSAVQVSLNAASVSLRGQLIEVAAKQGSIAVDLHSGNASKLKGVLPEALVKSENILKSVVTLRLTENAQGQSRLSLNTAQSRAMFTFPLSQHTLPSLTEGQVAQLNLNQLAQGKIAPLSGGAGETNTLTGNTTQRHDVSKPSTSATGLPNIDASDNTLPRHIKGSDVHHAITTLSRLLLSQTGNTNQALTQLLSILENRASGSAHDKLVPNTLSETFDKLAQQLKSLDVMASKPSQPLSNPKTGNTSVSGQSPSSTNDSVSKDAGLVDDNTSAKEKAQSPTENKANLASLAAALTSQAKVASNNLLQQLLTGKSKVDGSSQGSGLAIDVENTTPNIPSQEGGDAPIKRSNSDPSEQGLSQRIQHLLNSSALVTTPVNLTSPVSSSNFVQGLVALLQLALAGRALQRQPNLKQQLDAPDSFVTKSLSQVGSTAPPSRVSQELAQLDSKQQVLSQLKTLLANHQQSKVSSVDSRIQGQDSFYYLLPALSSHQSPVELLIKREHQKGGNQSAPQAKRGVWNVTMKLDIADSGQVLAKTKIDNDVITLDLYASNEVILQRLGDSMGYLTRRLSELGLTIKKSSFQRGHIPDTLNSRPHQIFETRV
ncbi:hypothetical protein D210916BOD24_05920 [Alteromonas sp. D210916BOD_24]|uniref:flagellar hook-length control protein FliK n=1 Tax=Alteromonas sp. D210916BOD_24 TaxID=3157618 RepID=UPI00399D189B